MLSDIEIAQAASPKHIAEIAEAAGVPQEYLEMYGTNKAKVDYNLLADVPHKPGKLILVTAINPTPAGEGKTTTTVGLADALRPSREERGGGAAGAVAGARLRHQGRRGRRRLCPGHPHGGHQPALHRRLPCHRRCEQPACRACWTTHIQQGNELGIDVRRITWKRVRGHERPPAAPHRGRPGRQGQRRAARGRLRHHRGLRGHGHLLPGYRHHRPEGAPGAGSWWATPTTTSPSRPHDLQARRAPWRRC